MFTINYVPNSCVCTIQIGDYEFIMDYLVGGYTNLTGDNWEDGPIWDESYGWFVTNPNLDLYEDCVTEKIDHTLLDAILYSDLDDALHDMM